METCWQAEGKITRDHPWVKGFLEQTSVESNTSRRNRRRTLLARRNRDPHVKSRLAHVVIIVADISSVISSGTIFTAMRHLKTYLRIASVPGGIIMGKG